MQLDGILRANDGRGLPASVSSRRAERFDHFIRRLYAGASGAAQDDWLAALGELFDAEMTSLSFAPTPQSPITSVSNKGFGDNIGTDYIEHFQYIDPVRKILPSKKQINIKNLDNLFNGIDKQSEYYRRFFSHLEINHSIYLGMKIGASPVEVFLFRKSGRKFTENDSLLLKRVAPHLETAWRVRDSMHRGTRQAQSVLAAFDSVSFGFAMVSPSGNVLHANPAMHALLDAGTHLTRQDGKLAPSDPSEAAAFNRFIRQASSHKSPLGGQLQLGKDVANRLDVILAPLHKESWWPEPAEISVAVFATSPAQRSLWTSLQTAPLAGLTPRESEIVGLLMNGMPSRSIAAKLGIRTGSVRAHIKSVLAKTNTHSQTELLSLLFRNGPHP